MAENFQSFIEEAFIDPIRSVVIVDDDYPTIEEVLGSDPKNEGVDAVEQRQKDWVKSPQQVMEVVSEFRSKEKKYILDIHDAQNLTDDEEVDGAAHLHQTDLLVLDYQLNPENADDHTPFTSDCTQTLRQRSLQSYHRQHQQKSGRSI